MAKGIQYSEEVVQHVCALIAGGMSLRKACDEPDTPSRDTFNQWIMTRPDVSDQYTRAREMRADARADRIDDITTKVEMGLLDPNAARVIIDAEKWQAGKENSKRYGDKLSVEANVAVSMSDDQVNARVSQLIRKAGIALTAGGTAATEGEA